MKIADCAMAVHMSVAKAALISSLRSSVCIEPILHQDRKIVPRAWWRAIPALSADVTVQSSARWTTDSGSRYLASP